MRESGAPLKQRTSGFQSMTIDTKVCPDCGQRKELSAFSYHKGTKDNRTSYCRPCVVIRSKRWAAANPEKRSATAKAAALRSYGLTQVQYDEMLRVQGSVCAICHRPNRDKVLVIDHCHTTGLPRALLCDPCNWGLGHYQDNPDRLRAAAAYVELHVSAHDNSQHPTHT